MPERIPQSNTLRVPFQAVLSTDHASAAAGKVITIKISKNGAAYANPSAGSTIATEIGSGTYFVDLSTVDTGTLGPLTVLGTATGVDNVLVAYDVVVATTSTTPTPSAGTPTATDFLAAVDIGNRALQHCGAEMMDSTLGFTEISKNARQVSFAYPKLRRAELRRNVWKFATRRTALRAIDTNTLILSPSLWVATVTYFVGSIVADENGKAWISRIPNNLNAQPQNYPSAWESYFGPLTVTLYDSTLAYFSGELVYTTAGDGTNRVFISLINSNSDNPATATAYAAATVYFQNQVVTYLSVAYMSLIDLNTGQTPTSSAAYWASGTTYSISAAVTGSDGIRYTSIAGGNVGHDPTTTTGFWTNTGILTPWTTVFTSGTGSLQWREIGGAEFPNGVTLVELNAIYPVGSGPASQSVTRNVYQLPAGFLRTAPQDPKAGSTSFLGSPTGIQYTDWNFESRYIVTAQSDPILLRFVADITDVAQMDDMFCEGLAARIALEVCEALTQSTAKLTTIASEYKQFMGEARTANAIETGAQEAPLDDYISTRI